MHWTIAAPFSQADDPWLAPFVLGDHTFEAVARPGEELNWHDRRSAVSSPGEWWDYARQGYRAVRRANGGGVITVFPQLAATVGALTRTKPGHTPVVAWFFNTELYGGIRHRAANMALARIDRFVVHSQVERRAFSDWLGQPLERFVFVPLQYGGPVDASVLPDDDDPFVLAVGSGHRDFATLFAALETLGYRTVVISSERALAGLTIPSCVEVRSGVPRDEIRRLVRKARVNAIPMTTDGVVGGTVTIVETMRHGRAPVVTSRGGVEDYVTDEVSGLLVAPRDVDGFRTALERGWTDASLRRRLDAGASAFADANCSDEAAGRSLGVILDELAARHGHR